jgi:hypothetical protein
MLLINEQTLKEDKSVSVRLIGPVVAEMLKKRKNFCTKISEFISVRQKKD